MKKVARMRMSPTNMNEELSHHPSGTTQSSNETIVRTTGRIKKPKAVFDPSDNYLPRAQRLSSAAAAIAPHLTQQTYQASSSLERRASYTKASFHISSGASTEQTALHKDVCIICKKRESKRPIFATKNRLISCLVCEKKIHKLCLKVDFEDLEQLQGHYKCEQCTVCKICHAKFINPDEEMITCSKCVKSYHIDCFPTKIMKTETNVRNWKCNKCQVYNQITNGTTLPVKKIREIIGGGEPSPSPSPHPTPSLSPPKPSATTITKTSSDLINNNGNSEPASSPIKRSHDVDTKNDSNKSEESSSISYSSPDEKRTKTANSNNNNQTTDTISLETNLSSNAQSKPDSANLCFSPNEHFDDIPDVKQWSVDQVYEYFAKHFPKEAHVFKEQEIDGRSLLLLKRSDIVKKLPIKLGPSLRIYSLILKIQAQLNDPTLGWHCGL